MTGMDETRSDRGAALLALFALSGGVTEARRAGYINDDGTVTEIPPDEDGVVRVR